MLIIILFESTHRSIPTRMRCFSYSVILVKYLHTRIVELGRWSSGKTSFSAVGPKSSWQPSVVPKHRGNMAETLAKRTEREKVAKSHTGSVFSPSSVSGQCGLSVLTSAKEELSRCITMTFTPPFILALSNGLWTANPPHRGVAALSLRPRSQHTLITIGPTKGVESGEWGPSAAWPA